MNCGDVIDLRRYNLENAFADGLGMDEGVVKQQTGLGLSTTREEYKVLVSGGRMISRYKFHRAARYLLAVPMVFLLAWWAAALILAVLPFEGAPRIAVFAAIFAILACALLWYLLKRYKNFKLSKLFVKNPNRYRRYRSSHRG